MRSCKVEKKLKAQGAQHFFKGLQRKLRPMTILCFNEFCRPSQVAWQGASADETISRSTAEVSNVKVLKQRVSNNCNSQQLITTVANNSNYISIYTISI